MVTITFETILFLLIGAVLGDIISRWAKVLVPHNTAACLKLPRGTFLNISYSSI